LRRTVSVGLLGATAGFVGAGVLATVLPAAVAVALGVFFGSVYGLLHSLRDRTSPRPGLKNAIGGVLLGVAGWVSAYILLPTFLDWSFVPSPPEPTGGEAIVALGAWVLSGLLVVVVALVLARFGEEKGYVPLLGYLDAGGGVDNRVVVLGGGFAGITAAQELERRFGNDPSVEITVVSDDNAVLFTPMLPEVAGGTLKPSHIYVPIRTSLRRTEVVQGEVTNIDTDEKTVRFHDDSVDKRRNPEEADDKLSYDHLVLTLGSVPDYKGVEGVEEFAFDFTDIGDAISIRNHVVSCFETADRVDDPDVRRAFTTFVVAGGGFSGAELAGALNDMARETIEYYSNISQDDLRVVVVHSHDRILPELSESLSEYALKRMRERGVEFILDEYVTSTDAERGVVCTESGDEIRTETLVWTVGNVPHPVASETGLPNEKSAVKVDEYLSVPENDGVWAAGDCASIHDAKTGERHPATAQHSISAAKHVGKNVHATVTDGELTEHTYSSKGQLCVIGKRSACAEVNGWQFSGLFAWMMWRAIYLMKLPGIERKTRVSVSWLIELFFPPDIVQTIGTEAREVLREE